MLVGGIHLASLACGDWLTQTIEKRLSEVAAALNERQRLYLLVAYDEDQYQEEVHRRPGLSPASVWRWMEYGPVGGRRLLGDGPLRESLQRRKLVDAGSGSTWASLAERGLILQQYRPTPLPRISSLFIRMTRDGRKAARILKGLSIKKPKDAIKPLSLTALRLLHYGQRHPNTSFDYMQPWAERFGMPDFLLVMGAARGLIKRGMLSGDGRTLQITPSGIAVDVAAEPNWRPFRAGDGGLGVAIQGRSGPQSD